MIDFVLAVMITLGFALVFGVLERYRVYKEGRPCKDAPPMSKPLPPLPVEEERNG